MSNPAVFRRDIVRMIACLFLFAGCNSSSTPTSPTNLNAGPELLASHGPAGGERLPFRGEYHAIGGGLFAPGEPGSEPRCNVQGLLTITFEVEGKASHVGHFTGTGSNCTAFPIPGPVAITDGVFTIRAANDDRLFGTYSGEQGAVDAEGSAPFGSAFNITGGTERFTSAAGEFQAHGRINFNTGQSSATFEGWIAYDASDRR